jgi:alkylated DNA repair dioxygenase AlkB
MHMSCYFSECFAVQENARILDRLLSEIHWQQDYLTFYGREIALPRLTAWYGDRGRNYTYSHFSMKPHPWTELLLTIKARVEAVSGAEYNSVLLIDTEVLATQDYENSEGCRRQS